MPCLRNVSLLALLVCAMMFSQVSLSFSVERRISDRQIILPPRKENFTLSKPFRHIRTRSRARKLHENLRQQKKTKEEIEHKIKKTKETLDQKLAKDEFEDIQIIQKHQLEKIMKKILDNTGLAGPVNMTGVTLPLNVPKLKQLIQSVESQFKHTPPSEEMQSDSPYAPIESLFYVGMNAPKWLETNDETIYFNISKEDPYALSKAYLNLWIQPVKKHKAGKWKKKDYKDETGKDNSLHTKKTLTTIVIRFESKGKKVQYVYSDIVTPSNAKWFRVDVTEIVEQWLHNPHMNYGITVNAVSTEEVDPVVISGINGNLSKVPVLEVEMLAKFDRKKRFAMNRICKTNRETTCCRDYFDVDFISIRWDFIVAPKKYVTNLCRGRCPFLYPQQYSQSALAQKIFNVTDKRFRACCGATDTDPLRMIYYDGASIKVTTINDMVVNACGCS